MKTLFNSLYYFLIAGICAVGLLVLTTLMPVPGNISLKVVKSGSMEPAIPVGSVIINKPAASYGIGDVITFGKDTPTQVPTTHRIVGTTGEGAAQTFTVRGDANNAPDATAVKVDDVHGKVLLTIPYLGYILAFAKTRIGFILLVGVPALFVCIEEVMKIIAEVKRLQLKKRRGRRGPENTGYPLPPQGYSPRGLVDLRGGSTYRSVVDLRRRSVDGMVRTGYAHPYVQQAQPRYGNRSFGAALVALLIVGTVSFAGTSGDTVAYYYSAQTATDNKLQARDNFEPDTFLTDFAALSFQSLNSLEGETIDEDTGATADAIPSPVERTVEEDVTTPEEQPADTATDPIDETQTEAPAAETVDEPTPPVENPETPASDTSESSAEGE